MRVVAVVAAAVSAVAVAGQAGLVSLSDPRFGVSALGPAGWTLRAASAASATLRGRAAGDSIAISVVSAPATPQSVINSPLARATGPWICAESGALGRCARTVDGGVLVVALTTGSAGSYRTLGGLNLVREVGESAHGFRPAATPPTPSASTSRTGVPDCDTYLDTFTQYLKCDKIPQAAKDAAQQAIDQMKSGWSQLRSAPDDARASAAQACRQATAALKQAASAMGCPF